jgi:hypothetical protein
MHCSASAEDRLASMENRRLTVMAALVAVLASTVVVLAVDRHGGRSTTRIGSASQGRASLMPAT